MNTKKRIQFCGLVCLAIALWVFGRLFYIQTVQHKEFAEKTQDRVYTQTKADTFRGQILDKNGVVLAKSLRTYAVALSKKNVNNKDALFKVLQETLGVPQSKLNKLWREKKNFFYVKKKVSPLDYEKLEKLLNSQKLTGVELEREYTRLYPYEDIAKDMIGATNSKNRGLSGLELMFDKELSQEAPSQTVKRSRWGGIIYDKSLERELSTADVYLTIDSLAQYQVESVLRKYAERYRVKSAIALVQEPKTGYIVAAASYPSLDGRALPFQFTYEPGSTFKTIGAAAALDSGTIQPNSIFFMENNKWNVNGIIIKDHQEKPWLTVSEILEVSSNIGAGKITLDLGSKNLFSYFKKFGFGIKTNVGFLGESAGILREFSTWKPIDTAKAGYGYTVSVSPIQLVGAYSVFANGGTLMQPHLIDRIEYQDGRVEQLAKPTAVRTVLQPNTVTQVKKWLENVVNKGTGKPAKVKGYRVAGKTGTTEKYNASGKYERNAHIASFCGFVPASNPEWTILVILDEPTSEQRALFGSASAKIFSEIASYLLAMKGVPPDDEVL
jgi:Cell division protein FtsI/penicillin-binding protein 2